MSEIAIPGWQDIFILRPESSLSPADRRALKRERAIRIANSPTGEHSRNVGRFLTFTDNVNDLLNAFAIVSSRWLKLIPRSHPLVAGAVTAARILDLARIISPFGFIGRRGKSLFEDSRFNDPVDNLVYAEERSTFSQLHSLALETLVVGQALVNVAGVGLSLGPIVGVANDLIASTPLGLGLEAFYSVIDPITNAALDVVADSPLAWLASATFSQDDHLTMALGTLAAWQVVEPLARQIAQRVPLTRLFTVPRAPRPTRDATTLSLLAELGQDPRAPARWPLPGEPRFATPLELAKALTPLVASTLAALAAEPWPPEKQELLFGALRLTVKTAAQATTPLVDAYREGLSPRARLFAGLLESPPRPLGQLTPADIAGLVRRAEDIQASSGQKLPDRAILGDYLDQKVSS